MKKHHHKERKNAICFIKHKMFVWRNKLAKQSLGPINQPPWPTLSSNWVPFLLLLAKKKKKNGPNLTVSYVLHKKILSFRLGFGKLVTFGEYLNKASSIFRLWICTARNLTFDWCELSLLVLFSFENIFFSLKWIKICLENIVQVYTGKILCYS